MPWRSRMRSREQADPVAALKAYEARAPRRPTAKVVLTNRRTRRTRSCARSAQRTGDKPFRHIDDVISKAEIMAISDGYKRVAGYDRESLRGGNRRATGTGFADRAKRTARRATGTSPLRA